MEATITWKCSKCSQLNQERIKNESNSIMSIDVRFNKYDSYIEEININLICHNCKHVDTIYYKD